MPWFARMASTPLADYSARRIVIIKPSALGDIVHALPVLRAIRTRYPAAHLAWVVNRALAPLLIGNTDLNELIFVDRGAAKRGWSALLRSCADLARSLRRGRFDLVIDLQGLLRSGIMTALTGAQRKVGLASSREGASQFYTDIIPPADRMSMHAVERMWQVAEAFGVGATPKIFQLPIQPAARDWAEMQLRTMPRPWLVVAAGARWLTKRWPPEHFAELVNRTQRSFGGTAILIGAPDERSIGEQVASRIPGRCHDFTGRTSLAEMIALIARADIMLGNDTGPLHVAAALGRSIIAPYTCTQVRLHGPYGVERGPVQSGVSCQGSYIRQCERMECMSELLPDRLWGVLREVLVTWSTTSRSA